MHNRPLTPDERLKCPRCPWCDGWCQYVESDESVSHDRRVGSYCQPWFDAVESDQNDAMGNDYGRGEWQPDAEQAIADYARRVAKHKAGEQDVW